MTKKDNSKIISVVHPICCGLDVHKDTVSACIIIIKHGRSFVDLGEQYLLSKSREKRVKMLKLKARHLCFNLVPVAVN